VGVEHLGIGSDAGVDGLKAAPHLDVAGIHHPQRVFDFADGLARRGYSDEAIDAILGRNFQRVFQTVLCV
jgi:membrane dipeptidase